MLARRKRVLAKIEQSERGEEPLTVDEVTADPEKERHSWKQIEKSERRLEKLVTDGTQLVSNVRVAGDSKEASRKQEEEELKKYR